MAGARASVLTSLVLAVAGSLAPRFALADVAGADEVLRAWSEKDGEAFEALAARDTPDPWMVADELLSRERVEVAGAFARAAPRRDVERLSEYVAEASRVPPDASQRARLGAVEAALTSKKWDGALVLLGEAGTEPPRGVVGIRLAHARGIALRGMGRFEESMRAFEAAADVCERVGWVSRAARILEAATRNAEHHRSPRAVLATGERWFAIETSRGNLRGAADAIEAVADADRALGEPGRALEHRLQGLALRERLGDKRALGRAMVHTAGFYDRGEDLAKALDLYGRAAAVLEKVGDAEGVAVAVGNAGNVHHSLGNNAQALELTQRALRMREAEGNAVEVARLVSNLAGIHWDLGDLAKALGGFEDAIRRMEAAHDLPYIPKTMGLLGGVLSSLGEHAKALEVEQEALRLAEAQADRREIARILGHLGNVHSSLGEFAEAADCFERSLALRKEMNDRWGANIVLGGLANARSSLGNHEEALARFGELMRMQRDLGDRTGAAKSLANVALERIALGALPQAIQELEEALREAEEIGDARTVVAACRGLAEAYMLLGEHAEALAAVRRGIGRMGSVFRGLADEQGARARSRHTDLFELGMAAAVELSDVAAVGYVLESGRAGALLESLGGRERMSEIALPRDLIQAEREGRAKEAAARRAYLRATDGNDRREIRARRADLEAATEAVQRVLERIQREAKDGAQVVHPQSATTDQVQEVLRPGEVLVVYGQFSLESIALVMSSSDVHVRRLGRTEDLVAASEALRLEAPGGGTTEAVESLRRLVVAPLALPADAKRVLVSPDGVLSYVPFALLLPDREVAYVPSGTTYRLLVESRDPRGEGILALGNPDTSAGRGPGPPGATRGGERLLPLPQTADEAKAIGTVLLLGKDATEEGLRRASAQSTRWRAIHLACHGLVDPEHPMRSSLALTPAGDDDGFLTALDVFRLRLPADLVVLSACETGKGRIVKGEGIVGFTRAFLFAGSPRVICSLWKVDDAATLSLMKKFYELWNPADASKGLSPATALRAAQEHVRSFERWQDPYYWAAWVLWGLP